MINQTRNAVLSGRIALVISSIIIATTIGIMSGSPSAHALAAMDDGQLDPLFGDGGKVRSPIGLYDIVGGVAIQEDQKIVVVGTTANDPTGFDFAVARYTVDGKLDPSFGTGGKATLDFQRSDDRATAVAIQPDGKIVLVGTVNVPGPPNPHTDFAATRFHPDGRVDLTFGVEGWATADLGSKFFERAYAVALQRDGKIVVGGETFYSRFDTNFGIVRFNANGRIDASFGADGIVIQSFGPSATATVRGLAVQRDENGTISGDKIIAVGYAGDFRLNQPFDFALVRYNPDGSLDPAFGNGGIVTTDVRGDHDLANAVVLQPDGKIVVAGGSSKPNTESTDFGLARYNADGSLDPHFGSGGIVITRFPASLEPDADADGDVLAEAFAVAFRDGKIVAFGDHFVNEMPLPDGVDFVGARYLIDGSLDTSFGAGGLVMTDFSEEPGISNDFGVGVAIQKDGKVVGVGSLFQGGRGDFGLVRYLGERPAGTF